MEKMNWEIKKLGEVCNIIMGQSPPSDTYNENANGLPFFQGKAEFTELHPIAKKYCSKPSKIAEPQDILLSVRAPVGTTNIANQRCCIGRGLAALRFENYKYGFFFLRSIQHELDSKGTGTTFRAISGETIRETLIPYPNSETQHAIVTKLEELFSELDKGIAELKTAQQQLKTYRQSVLKWAFEGFNLKKSGKKKLKDITSKIGSGSTPKGGSDSYIDSGIPLVRSLNIHFESIKFKGLAYIDVKQAEKLKNVIINEDDVLLNITGASIGRVNIAPKELHNGRVNQHVSIIRPKSNSFTSKYLKYYIQTSEIQNWILNSNYGVTRQALTKSMLENLEVPIPPIEEQLQIVQEIESRLSVADKLEADIEQSLQQAEALRQSILKKAFSGELVKDVVQEKVYKPKSNYFFQMQLIGKIAAISKINNVDHGEMTIAKYAYLTDKIFDIPTGFTFNRWHLGPYPPEIKKVINNKQYFAKNKNYIEVINDSKLFKSTNQYTPIIEDAVKGLVNIFSRYKTASERAHKTELLATVCKVIEDIKSCNLQLVRTSMKEWKIDLKTSNFKNKAEKFSENETKNCIKFIERLGWDKKLI